MLEVLFVWNAFLLLSLSTRYSSKPSSILRTCPRPWYRSSYLHVWTRWVSGLLFQIQAWSQIIIILNSPPKAALWPSYLSSSEPGLTNLGHHQTPSEHKATGQCPWPLDTAKGIPLGWASLRLPTFQQIKSTKKSKVFWQVWSCSSVCSTKESSKAREGIWPVMKCLKEIIGFPSSQPSPQAA